LRPFPQRLTADATDRAARWTRYRKDMIRQAGFVVYLAGNKLENGVVVPSSGMLEEFAIASNFGAIPIPIGMTGSVASELWSQVRAVPERFYGKADVVAELDLLDDPASSNEQVVAAVLNVMALVSGADEMGIAEQR
jgi:Sir2- and TIR-associating SLOG family